MNLINRALLDESVKAVVLVIDSGGGYADYCEEYTLTYWSLRLKSLLKPSLLQLSGGYYIAVAADHTYALPTSPVGSIGIIGRGPPIFIPSEYILETGAYKATGFSTLLFPFDMNRALDNFVSAVSKSRGDRLKLSLTQLKRGMIYFGSEALEVGLIDEIGSLQKAIKRAAEKAGLVKYEVIELGTSKTGLELLGSQNLTIEALDKLHPPPALHYLYLPSQSITQNLRSPTQPIGLANGGGKVLVDLSHGNRVSWWDLDVLIAELAKRNIVTSFISRRYDLIFKLAEASCLIIASPTQIYTEEECEAIVKFVRGGGTLIMFFDPAWEYIGVEGLLEGVVGPINSLSIRFGLFFAKGYLYNEEENFGLYRNIYIKNFVNDPLTINLTSLILFTSTHIRSVGES